VRLLDLFCGAGGAAVGYHRAGFTDIVGVDIKPQPRYPFTFVQGDALEYLAAHGREFDAIHASPPCQAYSRLRHLPWLKDREYPELLEPTRSALRAIGRPWVIENVEDAPMLYSVVLCGVTFGLPVYRHRRFGASFFMWQPVHEPHVETLAAGRASMATRYRNSSGVAGVFVKEINRGSLAGHAKGAKQTGRLMGIDWMRRDELTQAIPPAYTEWIGRRLMEAITAVP
jgi:DNA (cytosine-5)-methyltransferase 1